MGEGDTSGHAKGYEALVGGIENLQHTPVGETCTLLAAEGFTGELECLATCCVGAS